MFVFHFICGLNALLLHKAYVLEFMAPKFPASLMRSNSRCTVFRSCPRDKARQARRRQAAHSWFLTRKANTQRSPNVLNLSIQNDRDPGRTGSPVDNGRRSASAGVVQRNTSQIDRKSDTPFYHRVGSVIGVILTCRAGFTRLDGYTSWGREWDYHR